MLYNGVILDDCLTIWTKSRTKFGFKADSSVSIDSFSKTKMPFNVTVLTRMHFSTGTGPLAPIEDDDSSFLSLYSDKSDKKLYV